MLLNDFREVDVLMRIPTIASQRIAVARSTIELLSTIAALFGIESASDWRGISLFTNITTDTSAVRPVLIDAPALISASALQCWKRGVWIVKCAWPSEPAKSWPVIRDHAVALRELLG